MYIRYVKSNWDRVLLHQDLYYDLTVVVKKVAGFPKNLK